MDQEAARGYKKEKKANLRRYDINAETNRQRFRSIKKTGSQSYVELGVQLKDLFRKWTGAVRTGEVVKLTEIMVIEQLLNNMPMDLQVWVRQKKPKTVEEAGTQADDYVLARQGVKRQKKTCHGCGVPGHILRDFPKNGKKVEDKDQKEQAKDGESGSRKLDQPKCFKCGTIRHVVARCTKNSGYYVRTQLPKIVESQKKPGEIVCWGKIQGIPVEMLVDTGCSYTLVQRGFVPDECVIEGETVALQCAHGDVTSYQVVEVDMVIEGVKKTVRVGVSDSLLSSVLAEQTY